MIGNPSNTERHEGLPSLAKPQRIGLFRGDLSPVPECTQDFKRKATVKITPERPSGRNPRLLGLAFRHTSDGRVMIVFPQPDRVPATTQFVEVETEEGIVSVPVMPEGESPGLTLKDKNMGINPIQQESIIERVRDMRDTGPNPDQSI